MANVNLGQLNKPGFKTSLGAKPKGSRIVAKSLTSAKNTSLFSNLRVQGQWGTVNVNKANYQNARFALNPSGGGPRMSGVYAPAYGANVATNYNVQNGSNAYTAGQVVGTTLSVAMGILNKTGVLDKVFGGSSKVSAGNQLSQGMESLSAKQGADGTSFYGKMSGASSFADLNKIEHDIDAKKKGLDTDYQKVGADAKKGIDDTLKNEDVVAGLKDAGVEIDTSELTFSKLDPSNLEESGASVQKDIDNVTSFKNSKLPAAKGKVSEKAGQVKGQLSAKQGELDRSEVDLGNKEASLASLKASNKDGVNNAQIAKLEQEINKLKEKINKLKNEEIPKLEKERDQLSAAEKAIGEVETKCNDLISNLKEQKANIADMKKAEDNMKDKKYDLARTQKEQLDKAMTKIEKLNAEIKALEGKTDDKSADKLSKLIGERAQVYSSMSASIQSLSAAGETKYTDSKGKTVDFKDTLEKATKLQSEQPADPTPQAAQASQGSSIGVRVYNALSEENKNNINALAADPTTHKFSEAELNTLTLEQLQQKSQNLNPNSANPIEKANYDAIQGVIAQKIATGALDLS